MHLGATGNRMRGTKYGEGSVGSLASILLLRTLHQSFEAKSLRLLIKLESGDWTVAELFA